MKVFKEFSLSVFLGLASAFAQGKSNPTIEYDKKTKIDFEAKDVDGEFFRPDGQSVRGDKNLDFDSLLGPRNNFKKELKRSSGAIR